MNIAHTGHHGMEELRLLAQQLHLHADLIDTKDLDLGTHDNPLLQAAEGLFQLVGRIEERRKVSADTPCDQCAVWEQAAWEAKQQLQAVADERDRAMAALESIRLLATRHRHDVWGKQVMRFCAEGGVTDPL